MTDQQIEQEIQAKGLTAPRITPDDIEASIASEYYFTADQAVEASDIGRMYPGNLCLLTFCILIMHNGTKIVGINYGAIDPAQHSAQRGREEARKHAIEQIWPLLGYELRSYLHAMKGPLTADSVGPAA